jgi:hypothetical protein
MHNKIVVGILYYGLNSARYITPRDENSHIEDFLLLALSKEDKMYIYGKEELKTNL